MCPKSGACCDAGMVNADKEEEEEGKKKEKNRTSNLRYLYRTKEREKRTLDQSRVTPV